MVLGIEGGIKAFKALTAGWTSDPPAIRSEQYLGFARPANRNGCPFARGMNTSIQPDGDQIAALQTKFANQLAAFPSA